MGTYLDGEYGEYEGVCAECDERNGNPGITNGDDPPIWQCGPALLFCDICCGPEFNGAVSLKNKNISKLTDCTCQMKMKMNRKLSAFGEKILNGHGLLTHILVARVCYIAGTIKKKSQKPELQQ